MLFGSGLFSEERKKPLPAHPRTVGIITSPAGAAVRDVITVSRRRDPGIRLLLYPVQVQGKAAAVEIAHAIRFMNRHRLADVLIVGRGGGSMEDLWAFNEEAVVRAIAASEIPLISSVGHETDFTLSDFAADRRAATPSQAAELAVADTGQFRRQVERNRQKLEAALRRMLREKMLRWERLTASHALRDPLRITDRAEERMDRALMKLRHSLPQRVQNRELRLRQAIKALQHPERIWSEPERRLQAAQKLLRHPERLLVKAVQDMTLLAARLDAVSPLKVLGRGYSMTLDEQGRLLKSVDAVYWGEEIHTRLQDGEIYSVVQQIERREDDGR